MRKILLSLFVASFIISCQSKKKTIATTTEPKKDTLILTDYPSKQIRQKEFTLDYKIGQMIMVGIYDRKKIVPGDEMINELKAGKIGGIILFEKNIAADSSAYFLKELTKNAQSYSEIPLFIAIDEEGGKVHRLKQKYGFVDVPSAEALGVINNYDTTTYYAKVLGKVLADLGINMNFAPDIDVAFNPNNPVIAKVGRSYSNVPTKVAGHGLAAIRGYHAVGVKTAIKHFPGHGSSMTDSHLGLTDVTNQWKEDELIPFQKIIQSGQCDAVMTAHIVNRKLDTTSVPATLSKPIISGLLRERLKFNGVVFSDDMQMHAISKNYGLENAIRAAILAGVDILLFGNNVSQTDRITASQIHAILLKMIQSGEIDEARIDASFNRIMELKNKKVN